MPEQANIIIEQARTGEILVDVAGITDWTGLLAKLFATAKYGETPVLTLSGEVDSENNQIAFAYAYADMADVEEGRYYYEVVLYKADKSVVSTVTVGILTIGAVIKKDPTT